MSAYSKTDQMGQKRAKQDRAADRAEYEYVERRATHRGHLFCDWCGREITRPRDAHRHHVVPRSRGGATHRSNLALVHGDFTDEKCHLRIHAQGAPGWEEFKYSHGEAEHDTNVTMPASSGNTSGQK